MKAGERHARIEAAAAEWLVLMSERTVSLRDRARFEAWLGADPDHARVYRAQKRAWSAIAGMPHLLDKNQARRGNAGSAAPAWGDAHAARRRFRAVWPGAVAACLLAIVAGTWSLWSPLLPFAGQTYRTDLAQVRNFTLEDGSAVTLGASSRISVAFEARERRVTLVRGEAFFEIAHDPTRPFLVDAGDTSVRVVGTKFDMGRRTDGVRIAVLEGRVEVSQRAGTGRSPRPRSDAPTGRVLTAGQAVVTDEAGIAETGTVNFPDVGAWRSGRLVYVDARLRDIIADVNRYHGGGIELADPRLGDLQLTTTFRADQIDDMLAVLTRALPVEVVREDDDRIVLASRQR